MNANAPNADADFISLCDALIHTRQHVAPKRLMEPGPDAETLQALFTAAAAAPDHGRITPWRFLVLGPQARERLSALFQANLLARDPTSPPDLLAEARLKAFRAPVLILVVARLDGPGMRERQSEQEGPERFIPSWERLISLGAAIQNLLLAATARGFGSGLTSGRVLQDDALRQSFSLAEPEQAVCFITLGTPVSSRAARPRPPVDLFCQWVP